MRLYVQIAAPFGKTSKNEKERAGLRFKLPRGGKAPAPGTFPTPPLSRLNPQD